jgi:hypothetical protein
MKSSDRIDDYHYLWNGSEDWVLSAHYNSQASVKISFAGKQPTSKEIAAIRKLIPIYRNTPVIEVKSLLSHQKEIDLGVLSWSETNRMIEYSRELDLEVIAVDSSHTSYLPINRSTNQALLIEDNALANRIIEKMLKLGVPVVDFEESNLE